VTPSSTDALAESGGSDPASVSPPVVKSLMISEASVNPVQNPVTPKSNFQFRSACTPRAVGSIAPPAQSTLPEAYKPTWSAAPPAQSRLPEAYKALHVGDTSSATSRRFLARLEELGFQVEVVGFDSADQLRDLNRQEVWERLHKRICAAEFVRVSAVLPSSTFTPELRGLEGKKLYGIDLRGDDRERVRKETLSVLRVAAMIQSSRSVVGSSWVLMGPVAKVGQPSPWNLPPVSSLCAGASTFDSIIPAPAGEETSVRMVSYHTGAATSSWETDSPFRLLLPQNLQARPRVLPTSQLRGPDARQRREEEEEKTIGGMRCTARSVFRVPGHLVWGPKACRVFDEFLDGNPDLERRLLALLNGEKVPLPDRSEYAELRSRLYSMFYAGFKAQGRTYEDRGDPPDCEIDADLMKIWTLVSGDPGISSVDWLWDGAPAGILLQPDIGGVFPPAQEGDPEPPDMLSTDLDSFTNYPGVDGDVDVQESLKGFWERNPKKRWLQKCKNLKSVRKFLKGKPPVLSRLGLVVRTRKGRTKKRIILDTKESGVGKTSRKSYRVILPRNLDFVNDSLDLLSACAPEEPDELLEEDPPTPASSSSSSGLEEDVEWMILDFIDAFWLIPLALLERRYFVAKLGKIFYVFRRTPQGSRNGPFSWAVTAAHAARLAQSLFLDPTPPQTILHRRRSTPFTQQLARMRLRLNVYVDDPAVAVRGTKRQRDRSLVMLALCWLVLGFPLAMPKVQRGKQVEWIGSEFKLTREQVQAIIPQEKCDEILEIIQRFRSANVLSAKELKSFVGKLVHISGTILAWRPFVNELWAALNSVNTERTGAAPPGCIWLSQIEHALQWMQAFLSPERNPHLKEGIGLVRTWLLAAYLGYGRNIRITLDASPYGLGAVLEVEDKIIAFIESELTALDFDRFGFARGSPDGQQTWESLIALVALRAWKLYWDGVRVQLSVRGDNLTALNLLINLRVKGEGPSLIGRELALDLGDSAYAPNLVEHIPGVANDLSDTLSRRTDSKKQPWSLPEVLKHVARTPVPVRDASFYLSVVAPH
jgi:hypothetical protein